MHKNCLSCCCCCFLFIDNHKSSKSATTPLLPIYYDSYSNSSSIASHCRFNFRIYSSFIYFFSLAMNRSHETGSIDSSSSITHFHSLTTSKKSRQISIHKQVRERFR